MYDSCRNMASNRTQMNPERGDGPQEMQVLRVPGSLHRVHPMADSEEVTQHRSCAVPVEAHGGYITRQDHAVLGLGKSTKFVDHPASLRRSAPPQRPIHSQAHRPSPKVHFAHRPFGLEVSKQARTVTNGSRPHRGSGPGSKPQTTVPAPIEGTGTVHPNQISPARRPARHLLLASRRCRCSRDRTCRRP